SLPQVGTHPVIVELVGPAGAGKSAVADVLRGREHVLRVSIWGLQLRFVSWSAVTLLPTFLALCLGTHSVPWQEMKQMIRLGALRRFLARAATPRQRLIVLDEGPVFALSWLQVFGGERLAGNAAYQRWVRRTLAAWAGVLDVIARHDASLRAAGAAGHPARAPGDPVGVLRVHPLPALRVSESEHPLGDHHHHVRPVPVRRAVPTARLPATLPGGGRLVCSLPLRLS